MLTSILSSNVLCKLLIAVLFSIIAVLSPIRFANSSAVSGPVWLVVGVNGDKGSSVTPASPGGPS